MAQTAAYTERAEVHTLPNGLIVCVEPLPYLQSVSAGIWVRSGSANERPEEAGISHFLEHLFFEGTGTRTAREIMEAIESKGGHLNAFTSREDTCVYVKTLDSHVLSAIDILADVIKNSQFCNLEKERQVVLEEIASIEDVPEDYVHDLFAERFWPGHPLGRPVTGAPDTLRTIGLPEVRDYFERHYRPDAAVFSVAGNVDAPVVLERLHEAFGDWAPGARRLDPDAPEIEAGIHHIDRAIGQHHLCFGFPGPSVTDPRRYAYDVMSSALGGGSVSRLFDRIREREGLAYSIYTFHACYQAAGLFGVYAAVAPQNLARTVEIAFEELRAFRDAPVSADELSMNRELLKAGMVMALESTFNRMAHMAKSMLCYDRIVPLDEVIAAIDAVTAGDLVELARELFTPDQCAMAVLGPEAGHRVTEVPL